MNGSVAFAIIIGYSMSLAGSLEKKTMNGQGLNRKQAAHSN